MGNNSYQDTGYKPLLSLGLCENGTFLWNLHYNTVAKQSTPKRSEAWEQDMN